MTNAQSIQERMSLINWMDKELDRKITAYEKALENFDAYTRPYETSRAKCSPRSIRNLITLMREQLLLLEREI